MSTPPTCPCTGSRRGVSFTTTTDTTATCRCTCSAASRCCARGSGYRIKTRRRAAWPEVKIILRGDSGFCREELLSWCEENRVEYVLGLARNERLRSLIEEALEEAARRQQQTGRPARVYSEFEYQTLQRWSRARRVVAKAEQLVGKQNPRYVVTSLDAERWPPQRLYVQLYCRRGEAENRIKEQWSLFSDRMSTERYAIEP